MIPCRCHQKGTAEVTKENKADTTAKKVALEPGDWQLLLIPRSPEPYNYLPIYEKEKLDKAPKEGFSRGLGGHEWLVNERAVCQATRESHQGTHCGREALY